MDGARADDMGDDEQQTDVDEYERVIEDPPADLVIEADRDGPVNIDEWLAQEARPGEDDPGPVPPRAAEEAAMHDEPD